MTTITPLLKRGLISGALAGAVSGAFSYVLAERVMDRAVDLESSRGAAEQAAQHAAGLAVEHHAEVFSRSAQHAGLIVASIATGLALGVLLAVVYWMLHRREAETETWARSLRLTAAAFTGAWLVPFLRYPADPPGVGDPATVALRTNAWLAAAVLGLVGVSLAWRLLRTLAVRGVSEPLRQLAAAGIVIATLAATYILPSNSDAIEVPAALLWDFRLLSVAAALVLWGVLGVTFGSLGRRSAYRLENTGTTPAQLDTLGGLAEM